MHGATQESIDFRQTYGIINITKFKKMVKMSGSIIQKDVFFPQASPDPESAEPLHMQLCRMISHDIFRRRPKDGTPIVSERKLAESLSIARPTVHRAYERLIFDDILRCEKGKRNVCIAHGASRKVADPFPSIGIILPCSYSEFQRRCKWDYLGGLIDRASERGCAPILLQMPALDSSEGECKAWLESILPRLTGLIHLGTRVDDGDRAMEYVLKESYLPQIFVSGTSDNPMIGSVSCDTAPGFAALCHHLKECGHLRVGIMKRGASVPNKYFTYAAVRRVDEAMASFRENGLRVESGWILGDSDGDLWRERLLKIMSSPESRRPSVFWCYNDDAALELLSAAREFGLRVPSDMSIAGYDDIADARISEPPLTTLHHPAYLIGKAAIDLIIEHFEHGVMDANRARLIPATLVVRDSVKDLNAGTVKRSESRR